MFETLGTDLQSLSRSESSLLFEIVNASLQRLEIGDCVLQTEKYRKSDLMSVGNFPFSITSPMKFTDNQELDSFDLNKAKENHKVNVYSSEEALFNKMTPFSLVHMPLQTANKESIKVSSQFLTTVIKLITSQQIEETTDNSTLLLIVQSLKLILRKQDML